MGGGGRSARTGPPVVRELGDNALVERLVVERRIREFFGIPRRRARDARVVDDGPVRVGQDAARFETRRVVHVASNQRQRSRSGGNRGHIRLHILQQSKNNNAMYIFHLEVENKLT